MLSEDSDDCSERAVIKTVSENSQMTNKPRKEATKVKKKEAANYVRSIFVH